MTANGSAPAPERGSAGPRRGNRLRVALTQSNGRLEGLATGLAQMGYEVLRNPLIATTPRADAATRAKAQALLDLPWMLFTSRTAVEAWRAFGLPFIGPRIGAVGEKTARELARAGAQVSLVADAATAQGLAEAFVVRRDASGPVGLPQGDRARPTLRAALERAGYRVRPVTVYATVARPWTIEGPVDAVVLASPSAVRSLPDGVAADARLITLGPTTSRAVRARGYRPCEATTPSVAAVVEMLTREVQP